MTTIQGRDRVGPSAVDHRGLSVLGLDECLEHIASTPVGRVAFHENGEVEVLPVHHVVDATSVAFRARWDSRLASAVGGHSVAFEVDDYDVDSDTGWSVLVKGVAETVYDEATSGRLEGLLGVPWVGGEEGAFWVRIRPDEISGRRQGAARGESGCC